MKKLKKFMFSPKGTLVAFGAAMVLLLLSTIGGARAAVEQYSNIHNTEITTQKIGVSLQEKVVLDAADDNKDAWAIIKSVDSSEGTGTDAKFDQLGTGALTLPAIAAEGTGRGAKVGKTYSENLRVVNSGEIDQYVRVTIYKSWLKDGETKKDLYPSYIKLGYAPGWTVDENATTQERTVLYYTGGPLKPNGDHYLKPVTNSTASTAVPVIESITIDPAVSGMSSDGTYPYQGCSFNVEVQVDAVQTHNAEDAILSAWGKTVTTVDGDGNPALGLKLR